MFRRIYPQQPSGQAVVTGAFPSPLRHTPSFLSRIGFSIPTARRLGSNVANSRPHAFRWCNTMRSVSSLCCRFGSIYGAGCAAMMAAGPGRSLAPQRLKLTPNDLRFYSADLSCIYRGSRCFAAAPERGSSSASVVLRAMTLLFFFLAVMSYLHSSPMQ